MKRKIKTIIFFIILMIVPKFLLFSQTKEDSSYSFIVAGHAYGNHLDNNIGLYPKFLESINSKLTPDYEFIIFTGDALRSGTLKSFEQLENELEKPYYLCMGNHDNRPYARDFFNTIYGNSYYSFSKKNEKFVILNSQISDLSISDDQVIFLNKVIEESNDINNIFIFFHELLWNSDIKYKNIKSNGRCRHDNIKEKSNFWEDIFPILQKNKKINFYVIAGDVGGNNDGIPAYYEKINNVFLMASGMGEVKDENFLYFNVNNGKIKQNLYMLNDLKKVSIEKYNLNYFNDSKPTRSPIEHKKETITKKLLLMVSISIIIIFYVIFKFKRIDL